MIGMWRLELNLSQLRDWNSWFGHVALLRFMLELNLSQLRDWNAQNIRHLIRANGAWIKLIPTEGLKLEVNIRARRVCNQLELNLSQLRDWNVESSQPLLNYPELELNLSQLRDWNAVNAEQSVPVDGLELNLSQLRDWNFRFVLWYWTPC